MSNHRWTLGILIVLLALGMLACSMSTGGPTKPTAEILSPPSGSQVAVGEGVEVQYRASDAVAIARVELEADGEVVDAQNSPLAEGQPSMTGILHWSPTTPGTHTLVVYAYNRDRVVSDAVGVSIIAVEGPEPTAAPAPPAATHTVAPPTPLPPTPTHTLPAPSPTAGDGVAQIVLANNSGLTVSFVGIALPEDTDWGDNRLPHPLADGGTHTFQVAPGVWDLAAMDSNDRMISQRDRVTVSGTFNWTIQPLSATLILHNDSGVEIWYAYFTLSTEDSWGEDRLYKHRVPNGESYTWPVFPGTYDLKATDRDRNVLDEQSGVGITGTYDWRIAGTSGPTIQCPTLTILHPHTGWPRRVFGIQFERTGGLPGGYDYVLEFSQDEASWSRTQPVPADVRQDGPYWMAEVRGPGSEGTFYWRVCLVNMADPTGPSECCSEPWPIIHG